MADQSVRAAAPAQRSTQYSLAARARVEPRYDTFFVISLARSTCIFFWQRIGDFVLSSPSSGFCHLAFLTHLVSGSFVDKNCWVLDTLHLGFVGNHWNLSLILYLISPRQCDTTIVVYYTCLRLFTTLIFAYVSVKDITYLIRITARCWSRNIDVTI